MTEEVQRLKQLIDTNERILITSHISPDPDCLCSLLLLAGTLELSYPNKKILRAMEELSGELDYLSGYPSIKRLDLFEQVSEFKPDLVIIVDAMNFGRCTRRDSAKITEWIKNNQAALAIIDHHEKEDVAPSDVYINQQSPAAVQDVFEICFNELNLAKPEGYAQTTLIGLYSDTGGFIYDNPRHRETFAIVNDLLDTGVSLETIVSKLRRYSSIFIKALAELASNLGEYSNCTYSYVDDRFFEAMSETDFDEVRKAVGYFVNEFIRYVDERQWGFVVYRDIKSPGVYSASFRAFSSSRDVSAIAQRLGGGGHKPAAGAKFEAGSAKEAIQKVKKAILEP